MADQQKMPPLTGKTLGARITEARTNRGWGREEFRERLRKHSPALHKLGYSTVFNWEDDKKIPKMPALIAIAQLTGYSVEDLAEGHVSEDELDGPLSPERTDQLLETLGASEAIAREVRAELAAYPRKGGATREEVVMIHRLLTRRVAVANEVGNTKRMGLAGKTIPSDPVKDA